MWSAWGRCKSCMLPQSLLAPPLPRRADPPTTFKLTMGSCTAVYIRHPLIGTDSTLLLPTFPCFFARPLREQSLGWRMLMAGSEPMSSERGLRDLILSNAAALVPWRPAPIAPSHLHLSRLMLPPALTRSYPRHGFPFCGACYGAMGLPETLRPAAPSHVPSHRRRLFALCLTLCVRVPRRVVASSNTYSLAPTESSATDTTTPGTGTIPETCTS